MIIVWIGVFVVALWALVKGADWFLVAAERIGLRLGMTPFAIGVVITGVGTSLPELASSIAAVVQGVPEIVAANVVGSNVANMLLIIGVAVTIGRKAVIGKDLIDLELPLLAISAVLFLGAAYDSMITPLEAVLLLLAYGVYFVYAISHKEEIESHVEEAVERITEEAWVRRFKNGFLKEWAARRDYAILIIGAALLIGGAKYVIDAVLVIAQYFHVGVGVITITAVAVGTSLPELVVSVKAALEKKFDISVGNILGSNIFNALVIIGLPGMFTALPLDTVTYTVGLPFMAFATLLFIFSGISRNLYNWEGLMFILLYALFVLKLLGIS